MVLTAVVDFDFVVSCIVFGFFFFFFFFQAEDGIRDLTVTGVQTCALPISFRLHRIGALESGDPLRRSKRRPWLERTAQAAVPSISLSPFSPGLPSVKGGSSAATPGRRHSSTLTHPASHKPDREDKTPARLSLP